MLSKFMCVQPRHLGSSIYCLNCAFLLKGIIVSHEFSKHTQYFINIGWVRLKMSINYAVNGGKICGIL